MTTLAITGHRLGPKLGGYEPNPLGRAVQAALRSEMVRMFQLRPEVRVTKVISGMALGVDQWAAWIAVKEGVPFVAALPCPEQALRWSKPQRDNYLRLYDLAESVCLVSTVYSSDCMQRRNEWMVDNSDVLLAVWDGVPKGGTWNCIQYARKVGRTIVTVDVAAIRRGLEVRT